MRDKIKIGCSDSECPICEKLPPEGVVLPIRQMARMFVDPEKPYLLNAKISNLKDKLVEWGQHVKIPTEQCYFEHRFAPNFVTGKEELAVCMTYTGENNGT